MSTIMSICKQNKKCINEIFNFFFFVLSLQNQICIVHLEIILIQTSHILRAQEPHTAIGYYIGSIGTWSSYSVNTCKFLSQISS